MLSRVAWAGGIGEGPTAGGGFACCRDQAIGILRAVGHLSPDQGWDVLREVSRTTKIELRHGAELLIPWARTGTLCADVRTELGRARASCSYWSHPATPT